MAFNIYSSVISDQQTYLLNKLYNSKFLKRLYGKNFVWKIAITFLFYSFFIDFGSFVVYEEYRAELNDPINVFITGLVFGSYIWVFFRYKYLVKYRDNPSIGLKLINSESYINLKFIFKFGIYSNMFLFLLPIDIIYDFVRFDGFNLFWILDIIEGFVFVLITIPNFTILYIENKEQGYYEKSKNKIKAFIQHKPPVLIPVTLGN